MMTTYYSTAYRQRGVASLLISLVILVTITFVTLYTSRSVLMEQKISTNDYRGRMAFEAAETGLEAAVAAIALEWTIITTVDADGNVTTTPRETNVIFDTNDDGTVAGNTNSATLVNGSRVNVTLKGTINEDLVRYDITATGFSDDNAATRVINQTFMMVPPVPNLPDAPLLSRSSIVIGGSATVHNPEGNSTIWSGGDVNIGSNNATKTEIADPTDTNYPDCLGGSVKCDVTPSSSPDVLGLDIIGNDSSLSNLTDDEFFLNFLGETPANFKGSRADLVVPSADMGTLDGAPGEGKIVWVEGDVSLASNGQYGALTKPSLIVINGNLDIAGTNSFFGMLYVTGSITGTGNLTVTGAAVVNGVGTGGGSVDVWYNSQVLKLLNKLGGRPTGSSGSWRDF